MQTGYLVVQLYGGIIQDTGPNVHGTMEEAKEEFREVMGYSWEDYISNPENYPTDKEEADIITVQLPNNPKKKSFHETEIAQITWVGEDLVEAFENLDIPYTEENIEAFIKARGKKYFTEGVTQSAWRILENVVSFLKYDKVFNLGEEEE